MTKTTSVPATRKVRRLAMGGKRSGGHELQGRGRRVRRGNARRLRVGQRDDRVTGMGGLVQFNAFTQDAGIGRELSRLFAHLKSGRDVVYPMAAQMQLLIDATVAGVPRVFGLEMLASDPVFRYLAGGYVPSIDTVYRDLARFRARELESLENFVASQATAIAAAQGFDVQEEFIDIDTTVTVVFGEQDGARLGPNPRHRGRRSYHPVLAGLARTNAIIGARLRPGDTGLGENDIEDIVQWIERARRALGNKKLLTVRIDAGGDCAAIMRAIDDALALFIIKAKKDAALIAALASPSTVWRTVDRDADGRPSREVAEIDFCRPGWIREGAGRFRVIAVRTNERLSGEQVCLWPDSDLSVSAYITNDVHRDADDLARLYDDRAGFETVLRDLKYGFGIGKHSSSCFEANEAAFLLKVLAYNLVRRFVYQHHPALGHWRMQWLRWAIIAVPGRLLHSGGRRELRLAPRPMLH